MTKSQRRIRSCSPTSRSATTTIELMRSNKSSIWKIVGIFLMVILCIAVIGGLIAFLVIHLTSNDSDSDSSSADSDDADGNESRWPARKPPKHGWPTPARCDNMEEAAEVAVTKLAANPKCGFDPSVCPHWMDCDVLEACMAQCKEDLANSAIKYQFDGKDKHIKCCWGLVKFEIVETSCDPETMCCFPLPNGEVEAVNGRRLLKDNPCVVSGNVHFIHFGHSNDILH